MRRRETQRQKIDRLTWALTRVVENTELPANKRDDVAWLRSAVSLARAFAKAGLKPAGLPDGRAT